MKKQGSQEEKRDEPSSRCSTTSISIIDTLHNDWHPVIACRCTCTMAAKDIAIDVWLMSEEAESDSSDM